VGDHRVVESDGNAVSRKAETDPRRRGGVATWAEATVGGEAIGSSNEKNLAGSANIGGPGAAKARAS
jgi:hypothetical protein